MRGRYVGPVTTTFEAPVGTLTYGTEFVVPAGRERSFFQHGHIEPADKAAKDFCARMMSDTAEDQVVADQTAEPGK